MLVVFYYGMHIAKDTLIHHTLLPWIHFLGNDVSL
jgi:hypothetical protein